VPWGVGNWWPRSLVESSPQERIELAESQNLAPLRPAAIRSTPSINAPPPATTKRPGAALSKNSQSIKRFLFVVWLTGVFGFLVCFALRYASMTRDLRRARAVEEGPLRLRLERLALVLGRKSAPELLLSGGMHSPFLIGPLRPRIVLPESLPDPLSAEQMDNVLLHELVHWKRRDLWVGWFQVAAQALFWFHPLVWLANAQIRHAREYACDDAVLRTGRCERGAAPQNSMANRFCASCRRRPGIHP